MLRKGGGERKGKNEREREGLFWNTAFPLRIFLCFERVVGAPSGGSEPITADSLPHPEC